ncbi:14-3-3 domain-containing protein [Lactarius akahatsu]|uniref:14-3-3 domain-containing protein n=1 Tax=Lactarius akahatsu TaxID=416441 RepID=A0AAD4Q9Y7_9AGAM|nr:14-3-3 domain-containing protein [Lactarius akahatsu]
MSPVNTKTSRAECLALAKLAEQAERWDDVIKQLKSVISYSDARLTMEERNLLSIAYKHVTGTLRTSWRTVEGIEKQEAASGTAMPRELVLIRCQREKIELELADACQDLLDLLDRYLVPAAEAGEERVFYHKMHVSVPSLKAYPYPAPGVSHRQGDYHRYLAEFARRQQRERSALLALEAYKASYKHAFGTLPPWHPTRLGVALNFSVFFHDVRGSPDRACHLAKHAFDEAVAAMHATPEHTFRDSLMILHLLRDDIILWSAEMQPDETRSEPTPEMM